jgi:hypothetical protein
MILSRYRSILCLLVSTSFIFLLSCKAGCAATNAANGLALSVKLNKTEYVLGEPIVAEIKITNVGKYPINRRWFISIGYLTCSINDATGKIVVPDSYRTDQAFYALEWQHKLDPSQNLSIKFDLLRGDPIRNAPILPRYAYYSPAYRKFASLKPGRYRVRVNYNLDDRADPRSKNILVAPVREFTVRAPSPFEKEGLQLFQQNIDYFKGKEIRVRILDTYEQLWRDYRATRYTPYAIYYSGRILQDKGENGRALAKYDLLLRRYPKFPLKEDLLYYQALALRDAKQPARARIAAQYLYDHYRNYLVTPNTPMPKSAGGGRVKGSRIINFAKEMGVKTEE